MFMPSHGEVALKDILVCPAPGMMHTHRVIGGNGPIQKRPARLAAIFLAQLIENAFLVPEFKNRPLLSGEIDLGLNLLKTRHHNTSASKFNFGNSTIER